MQGAPRHSARSFFVLPLVIVLLALVALPSLAQAEGGTTYTPEEIPTFKAPTESSAKPTHKPQPNTSTNEKAEGSAVNGSEGGQGGGSPEGSNGGSSEEEESKGGAAAGGSKGNGGGNGGGAEGATAQKSGGGTKNGLSGEQKVAGGNVTPITHNTETSSGGGSSPVVPILIAVIVLAAISIGVVLYRQRKSGGQGPDRSVSSPNAS
jgi:cobalamin biosynthesis Mg chelatase CobN